MTKYILFSAILFGLAFTACSDDDDEAVVATIDNIAGEYLGTASGTMILINSSGEELPYDIVPNGDETAKVTVNSDGTISVVEPTFYSASPVTNDASEKYAYPGAIVKNIQLVQEGDALTFDVKDYSSMNGAYTVAGDISGHFIGRNLTLDYTFLHAGGMIGTVHFEGVRK
ncbi:MAG: hypothetical protein E7070_10255 [Bacteroidales bacterium]|nr:hypothetical protein [Bacteroidales bacterium]